MDAARAKDASHAIRAAETTDTTRAIAAVCAIATSQCMGSLQPKRPPQLMSRSTGIAATQAIATAPGMPMRQSQPPDRMPPAHFVGVAASRGLAHRIRWPQPVGTPQPGGRRGPRSTWSAVCLSSVCLSYHAKALTEFFGSHGAGLTRARNVLAPRTAAEVHQCPLRRTACASSVEAIMSLSLSLRFRVARTSRSRKDRRTTCKMRQKRRSMHKHGLTRARGECIPVSDAANRRQDRIVSRSCAPHGSSLMFVSLCFGRVLRVSNLLHTVKLVREVRHNTALSISRKTPGILRCAPRHLPCSKV